jgi:hypothetical protein
MACLVQIGKYLYNHGVGLLELPRTVPFSSKPCHAPTPSSHTCAAMPPSVGSPRPIPGEQVRSRSPLALRVFRFSATLNLMEYRGTRYTIRAGIEHGKWLVVIHPEGVEVASNKIFRTREDAESHARRMIDNWLKAKYARRANNEGEQN